jgi:hypothetical protein
MVTCLRIIFMQKFFFLILLSAASMCAAQQPPAKANAEKAPIPAQLTAAHTMCLKIKVASDADVAEARSELKTWGRFQVKEDCAQADVSLWITARVIPEVKTCGAVIQVTSNTDQSILWTGNMKCDDSTQGIVGRLVRELRKDMTPPSAGKTKQ